MHDTYIFELIVGMFDLFVRNCHCLEYDTPSEFLSNIKRLCNVDIPYLYQPLFHVETKGIYLLPQLTINVFVFYISSYEQGYIYSISHLIILLHIFFIAKVEMQTHFSDCHFFFHPLLFVAHIFFVGKSCLQYNIFRLNPFSEFIRIHIAYYKIKLFSFIFKTIFFFFFFEKLNKKIETQRLIFLL